MNANEIHNNKIHNIMTNTEKQPTKIDGIYLSKKLFKQYARPLIKEGKSEQEIKDGFTLELLNKMADEFCEKYNFTIK